MPKKCPIAKKIEFYWRNYDLVRAKQHLNVCLMKETNKQTNKH